MLVVPLVLFLGSQCSEECITQGHKYCDLSSRDDTTALNKSLCFIHSMTKEKCSQDPLQIPGLGEMVWAYNSSTREAEAKGAPV